MDTIFVDHWRPVFRHSAGNLGSAFMSAARNDRKLIGWKAGKPAQVMVPPKDLGVGGEWVDIGPGATLIGAVPADWAADSGEKALVGFVLGHVRPDGADTALLALVAADPVTGAPARGARLAVRFRSDDEAGPYDFWFVPDGGAQ